MTIISAKRAIEVDGFTVDQDVEAHQIQQDFPALKERHRKALATDPMWEFFGGVIDIGDRTYQVA